MLRRDQTAAANSTSQDVTVPPIAANPTQGGQRLRRRASSVSVQGDLNNALTQQQGQLDGAVANSTLPTEPATVAPIRNGANGTAAPRATERQTAATRVRLNVSIPLSKRSRSRSQAVAKTPVESKPVQPKHVESGDHRSGENVRQRKQTGGHRSEQTDHDDRSASGNGSAGSEEREDGR
ncbi:Cell division protein DamX [Klebsiella pneumoniae]|nr:Cell division protein DamX [Klebsiella pneumoniae]